MLQKQQIPQNFQPYYRVLNLNTSMHVVNHESREKHDFPHIKHKITLHIKGHVIIILINIVDVLFYFGLTTVNTVNIIFICTQ